jgi:parvulin-like peptidyl-prolyl isomerase
MKGEFAKEISVPKEEVEKYYLAHNSEPDFQWVERVTGAHILIEGRRAILGEQLKLEKRIDAGPELEKAIEAEIERRAKLAEQIYREAIAPGADFAALAKKYSDDAGTRNDGGRFGTFAKGTHVLPLDDAFFNLKPGEVGPVVKTEYGFHVIKVLARQPAGTRTLEESKPQIQHQLSRAKIAERMRDWLKQARAKSAIAVRQ